MRRQARSKVSPSYIDGCEVSAALVGVDFVGCAIGTDGLREKAFRGLFVTIGCEQIVDGVTVPVDSAVEVFLLALDLDVGLVEAPAIANRLLVLPDGCA